MIAALSALAMTALVAAPAPAVASAPAPVPASDSGESLQPEGPVIYWPIAYSAATETRKTSEIKRFEALMARQGHAYRVHAVPIRRAFHMYRNNPHACMISRGQTLRKGELESKVFAVSNHWLYVRRDAGFKALSDLRSAGTLEGAEQYVDLRAKMKVRWQFAPSYEALIAMVEGGRVDAATLGPPVEDGVIPMPENLVRIGDKPFARLEIRMHCTPGRDARALIDMIDKRFPDVPLER